MKDISKQAVVQEFLRQLDDKIDGYQFALDQLSISVLNETKSTAGDKHETALSMLQLEQSQVAKHMYEAIDNKTVFSQINFIDESLEARLGSLIQTNHGLYLLSLALPKIMIDNKSVIAISIKSPLGEQLMGKKVGETIEVNSIKHTLLYIL